jgi:hypothetical protein
LVDPEHIANREAGYKRSADDSGFALEQRFVLFFDFLGASNAAINWPRERLYEFVDLLISIATLQSSEDISGSAQPDGSYRLLVTPEITTFSDNIVVSYPGVPDEEYKGYRRLAAFWAETVCTDAVRILSGVAEAALRVGLLIRGGLSFGELYHQKGVVFGEALVDAHLLEKEIAGVPRIIVSARVLRRLTNPPPESVSALLQDADGKWHLNYFTRMLSRANQATDWKRAHLDRINGEIDELRGNSDPLALRRVAKWEWFRKQFEAATTALN